MLIALECPRFGAKVNANLDDMFRAIQNFRDNAKKPLKPTLDLYKTSTKTLRVADHLWEQLHINRSANESQSTFQRPYITRYRSRGQLHCVPYFETSVSTVLRLHQEPV